MKQLSTCGMVLGAMLILTRAGVAGTDFGQFCWQLTPYVDTLRLAVTQAAGGASMFQLHVSWRAKAPQAQQTVLGETGVTLPATYQLLGTGTARESVIEPGQLDIGFTVVRGLQPVPPPFQFICDLSARINFQNLSGPWLMQCTNNLAFIRSGTLVWLPVCAAND